MMEMNELWDLLFDRKAKDKKFKRFFNLNKVYYNINSVKFVYNKF